MRIESSVYEVKTARSQLQYCILSFHTGLQLSMGMQQTGQGGCSFFPPNFCPFKWSPMYSHRQEKQATCPQLSIWYGTSMCSIWQIGQGLSLVCGTFDAPNSLLLCACCCCRLLLASAMYCKIGLLSTTACRSIRYVSISVANSGTPMVCHKAIASWCIHRRCAYSTKNCCIGLVLPTLVPALSPP